MAAAGGVMLPAVCRLMHVMLWQPENKTGAQEAQPQCPKAGRAYGLHRLRSTCGCAQLGLAAAHLHRRGLQKRLRFEHRHNFGAEPQGLEARCCRLGWHFVTRSSSDIERAKALSLLHLPARLAADLLELPRSPLCHSLRGLHGYLQPW